jgi:hypothetical protein
VGRPVSGRGGSGVPLLVRPGPVSATRVRAGDEAPARGWSRAYAWEYTTILLLQEQFHDSHDASCAPSARPGGAGRGPGGRPERGHQPQGLLRIRYRRRLPAGQLPADLGLLAEAGPGIRPDGGPRNRDDRRRPDDAHGHRLVSREHQKPGSLSGHLAPAGPGRGSHR